MSRIDEIKELTGASSVTYEKGYWCVRWQELLPHYVMHFDFNASDKHILEKTREVQRYYDHLLEQRAYEERVRQEERDRCYSPKPVKEPPKPKKWSRPLRNKARFKALRSGRVMR